MAQILERFEIKGRACLSLPAGAAGAAPRCRDMLQSAVQVQLGDYDEDMMSFTAVSSTNSSEFEDLRDELGTPSQASIATTVFEDLPNEDALCKTGRFLQMTWHVIVQL